MKNFIFVLLLLPLLLAKTAWAACTINGAYDTAPMPLQIGNITAGNELANGTELYKQTYNLNYGSTFTTVTCAEGTNQYVGVYTLYNLSGVPITGVGPSGAMVYPTNIPGIGAAVGQGTNNGIYMPGSKPVSSQQDGVAGCTSGTTCIVINNFKRWDLHLIKTGPIAPGTLLGSSLPCVQVNFNNTGAQGQDGLVEQVCMSGQINIVSQTCTTPDVNVDMGTHDASEFKGTGTGTEWIDASIQLTGCPAFFGYGASGNWYADGSGANSGGTQKQNTLGLKLTPNSTIINSSTGIFDLTSNANSASGVGIQLAYGTSTSQIPVNFANTANYPQPLGSSTNVTLPLVARYIQTGSSITAGQANSTVTFLINYQ